jgi:hypothetical protein
LLLPAVFPLNIFESYLNGSLSNMIVFANR